MRTMNRIGTTWYFPSLLGILLIVTPMTWGEEVTPVEERVQKLEDENQLLRDLVRQMQSRLDQLEGKTSLKEEAPKSGGKKKKEEKSVPQIESSTEPVSGTDVSSKSKIGRASCRERV